MTQTKNLTGIEFDMALGMTKLAPKSLIMAALILIQKQSVKVTGTDTKGRKTYGFYSPSSPLHGMAVNSMLIRALGRKGLVHLVAGQPRLTVDGTTKFYLFVNGR
jgi:hypothetical protein